MAKSYQITSEARAKAQEAQELLDALSEFFNIPGDFCSIENNRYNNQNPQALVYHLCDNWSNDSGNPSEDEIAEGDLEDMGFTDEQIELLINEGYLEPLMDSYEELIEDISQNYKGSILNYIDKNGVQDIVDITTDPNTQYVKYDHPENWQLFIDISRTAWVFDKLSTFSV